VLACVLWIFPAQASAVELTFWTTEIDEGRLEVIHFLIDAFSLMQDEVIVKLVSVNENALFERAAEIKGKETSPDLVEAGCQLLVALGEEGLVSREEASRVVHRIGASRFYPGSLNMLVAQEGQSWYGVPFHGWVQGIWYRADWFKEARLAPPTNWMSILAAAKYFYNPEACRYGIVVGTAGDHYAEQVFTQIARSNAADMFDGEGHVIFDNPAMVEALRFYKQLAQYGPSGPQMWRARDYFIQGRLAMLFYSSFIMDDLALERVAQNSLTGNNFKELNGASFDPNLVRNIGMVSSIRHKRVAGYGTINGFGIAPGLSAEKRAAVASFLAFLYEPAHYVTWLHMAPGGMMPVLRGVATSGRFLADPSGIFRRYGRKRIKSILAGLSSIETFSNVDGQKVPAASIVYAKGIIPRMISRTVFEQVSAQESVSHAAREIKETLRLHAK
jgi:multiple sugar transport system substrate-binding protein